MSNEEIKDKLLEIIKLYLPEETNLEDVTADKDLVEDLKINSAHIVDIIISIEETFDIMIEDNAVGEMKTLEETIDIIQKKLAEA